MKLLPTLTRSLATLAALLLLALPGTPLSAHAPAAPAANVNNVNNNNDDDDSDETDDTEEVTEVLQEEVDPDQAEADAEADMREGEINILTEGREEGDDIDGDIDIPIPAFIDQAKNRLELNGADWSTLRQAVNAHKITPLSIVHIGDSHIQANFGTGVTRELLQYRYGNAGRGIIAPLKMSGTNQPTDYVFSSTQPYTAVKLMKAPWRRTMGFTGTSISPSGLSSNITVGTRTDDDYDPFSTVTLFHRGQLKVTRVTDEHNRDILFTQHPSRDFTFIKLASPQTRVTIHYDNLGDLTLFGANLSGDRPGVFYHSIGNNGATFDTYNRIGEIGPSLKALNPNLVVISLGTNEAFGRFDADNFTASIDRLVRSIRTANPKAEILLVTPMECHRTTTKTVTKRVTTKAPRSRKGKSRKRRAASSKVVKQKVKTSGVNSNVRSVRDAILKYGRDNGVAVYDFYDVAGGDGASALWIDNGLFSPDKIHHSVKGYRVEGRLLYDALVKALQ